MNVVSIRRGACKETVAALQHLLDMAQRGELRGLALCAKDVRGGEQIAFTGDFSRRPAEGLSAAMRMSWRLTQLEDERHAH